MTVAPRRRQADIRPPIKQRLEQVMLFSRESPFDPFFHLSIIRRGGAYINLREKNALQKEASFCHLYRAILKHTGPGVKVILAGIYS